MNIRFNFVARVWMMWMVARAGQAASAHAEAPSAQTVASTPAAAGAAGQLPGEGYRNGSQWISAERQLGGPSAQACGPASQATAERGESQLAQAAAASGPACAEAGLVPVVLHAGAREFHARIDAHAIVQLTAGSEPEVVWKAAGLRVQRVLSSAARIYLVAGAAGEDGLSIAQRLARAPVRGVLEAIPDLHVERQRYSIALPPDDPRYPGQWYLRKIGIADAWQYATGTRDTTVVVVDDGCDMQHPDLKANLLGGLDVVDADDDPSFEPGVHGNAHGTQCSGVIAAQADNGIGIAGACPECTLRCVRLLNNHDKAIPLSADVQAFDYALTTGASVVSNSWGFGEAMPAPAPLRNLLVQLYHEGRDGRGTLVLFAAGNENRVLEDDELTGVEGVIAVGAINNFDEATSFSNHGASLFLTAPTGTITTDISGSDGDDPSDYTELFGGTSSACPVAAGVAALLLSAKPELSASDVRELLRSTTREAPYADSDADGHDATYGYGIINPAHALRSALGIMEPEQVDAGSPDSGKDHAAADGGGSGSSHASHDSGCDAVPGPAQAAAGAAWFATALAACAAYAARRRRVRRAQLKAR